MRLIGSITLGLALVLATSAQARADLFLLDPAATYLHTSADDPAPAAAIIDLSTLSFSVQAGTVLQIQQVGAFEFTAGGPDTALFTGAVFSSTNTLLSNSNADRVPDAITPTFVYPTLAFPFVTAPTDHGAEPTDIPQDFAVARGGLGFTGVTVVVPAGAKFLFVAAEDQFFSDNTDPSHTYGVTITLAPEPSTLSLFGIGAVGVLGYAWRRRKTAATPSR